jgi:hypothetical protein
MKEKTTLYKYKNSDNSNEENTNKYNKKDSNFIYSTNKNNKDNYNNNYYEEIITKNKKY